MLGQITSTHAADEYDNVTMGVVNLDNAMLVKITNVVVWRELLTQYDREKYLQNPAGYKNSDWEPLKEWNGMMKEVLESEELREYFTKSNLQVGVQKQLEHQFRTFGP